VKAFNTQFASQMDSGTVIRQQLDVFAAADDASTPEQVLQMARTGSNGRRRSCRMR